MQRSGWHFAIAKKASAASTEHATAELAQVVGADWIVRPRRQVEVELSWYTINQDGGPYAIVGLEYIAAAHKASPFDGGSFSAI
ncbi:hypothetical protein [Mycobacteroides abscessus]|uniref:hypothetical protein n=1 Tax=Mycobacteroides abscessus TaxID=36809 RepID=UPI0013F66F63|nr:hypothetical protein [Mycobacteroides abscessus]